MYEAYYGLKQKPFTIQPDPDFLFFGPRHGIAYAMLEYAVLNRAGFAVISGEIGCGKTTLIRHLLNKIGPEFTVGLVLNTHQDIGNLLEWIMLAFALPYEGMSQVARYDAFQKFLIAEYAAGRRVVLIVDEAQNLSPSAVESLRMLSNINVDKDQLLQIILVGQPQIKELLQRPDMQQMVQRIAVHFFLPPLDPGDVEAYIRHRLNVAGRDAPLFTTRACERIAEVTKAIPRSINILCDTALVYGFAQELQQIDVEVIDEVVRDRKEYGLL